MAATKAGQLKFTGTSPTEGNEQCSCWTTDGDNGFSGQIVFKETILRDYDYYQEYVDDNGYSYFDICVLLNSQKGLLKIRGDEKSANVIDFDKIFKLTFTTFKNQKYSQNFDIVLYNSANNTELVIKNYMIPANSPQQEHSIYFSPENFNNSSTSFYDTIIFRVDRNTSSKELIMELKDIHLYELQNQIDLLVDEQENPIDEFLGLTIETVNRGECRFFINSDVFCVGNDRVLNIDENLNLSITKFVYLDYIPNDTVDYFNSDNFITALVNYKY